MLPSLTYIAKTTAVIYTCKYFPPVPLKTLGNWLNRLVSEIPPTYTPLIGVAIINIFSDVITNKVFARDPGSKWHLPVKLITKVAIGASFFALGTALTSGSIAASAIVGAKMGTFIFIADSVARLAIAFFLFLSIVGIGLLNDCVSQLKKCLKSINNSEAFSDSVIKNIPDILSWVF